MKKLLLYLFLLSATLCSAQEVPSIIGKPLVSVTTIDEWNFNNRPAGWYRIAKIASGYRGNSTFELRENADHSTLRFEVGLNFNSKSGSSLTVTNHSYYGSAVFRKVRLLTESTYADAFLEVYVSPHNNDSQRFYAFLINSFADADWTLLNWTAGIIPEGYTSSEFDVDQLLTVGNINHSNVFSVNRNGNVGIGTTSPDSKLSVRGRIRAQEVKVEMANWPDYVFAKSYQLPSLQETEKHIKDKGYLPGIPSALEVKANGIDLGEMNAKLLQKREELTLHLINKDKEVKDLKHQIEQQDVKVRLILNKLKL